MSRKIYLFNPENDLALANGNENFESPSSAKKMAGDLSFLPCWYADENSIVLVASRISDEQLIDYKPFEFSSSSIFREDFKREIRSDDIFVTWGQSPAVYKFWNKLGGSCFSSDKMNLEECRKMSHRSFAIETLIMLHEKSLLPSDFYLPQQISTLSELQEYAEKNAPVVLKAPWSGSGKGLLWCRDVWSEKMTQWSRRFLEKQGSLIIEKIRRKKEDFAMEFYSDGKEKVTFAGYSAFVTNPYGVYQSNRLESDADIEQNLTNYVPIEQLKEIQKALLQFFSLRVPSHYEGYFGVDMMICENESDSNYFVHPCVEINLRMNMGVIARIIYDRHVASGSYGRLFMDYYPDSKSLQHDHTERSKKNPCKTKNGRITQGYLSLCPIGENTTYRARIEILKR